MFTFLTNPVDETIFSSVLKQRSGTQMVALYIEEAAKMLGEVRTAVTGCNPTTLREAAHSLKGSSSYLGAKSVQMLSFELEKIGKSGVVDGTAETLLAQLEMAFQQTCDVFEKALLSESVA